MGAVHEVLIPKEGGGMADSAAALAEPVLRARDVVRSFRKATRLSQEDFAHAISVTYSTVSRWENAHVEPSRLGWQSLNDLAEKRGIDLSDTDWGRYLLSMKRKQ